MCPANWVPDVIMVDSLYIPLSGSHQSGSHQSGNVSALSCAWFIRVDTLAHLVVHGSSEWTR